MHLSSPESTHPTTPCRYARASPTNLESSLKTSSSTAPKLSSFLSSCSATAAPALIKMWSMTMACVLFQRLRNPATKPCSQARRAHLATTNSPPWHQVSISAAMLHHKVLSASTPSIVVSSLAFKFFACKSTRAESNPWLL
ncbi:hypothetical protein Bca52824_001467 [Brassica carinata]|uniref:Uncharacterized protein n=1 Tax=Brassica carinata TaxID=52824 RepID=A0A8X7WJ60_BRACI|nr:hypothetical protein Bca52824_001467 [Brassica carinata]